MHSLYSTEENNEDDLAIPLSYDTAWKIFNRWPREVSGKRRRLGERKSDALQQNHSNCYCAQKKCTRRCPFFGLYKKATDNIENKPSGIISHKPAEQPRMKETLNDLKKWYANRCKEGSNEVLNLKPLEQLRIKYKLPAYELETSTGSRYQACNFARVKHTNIQKAKEMETSSKSELDCSSSKLFDTIENQLRNLSVSQSRLKNINVSLCRLAYTKKKSSKTKLKQKFAQPTPSFSNALRFLNISTGKNIQNSLKSSFNVASQESQTSKSTKSKNLQQNGRKTCKVIKAGDISKSSKGSKIKNKWQRYAEKSSIKSDKNTSSSINSKSNSSNNTFNASDLKQNRIKCRHTSSNTKSVGSFHTMILRKSADPIAQPTTKAPKADRAKSAKLPNKRTIIDRNDFGGSSILISSADSHSYELSIDCKAQPYDTNNKKKRARKRAQEVMVLSN